MSQSPHPGWEFHPDLDEWQPPDWDKPDPADEVPQIGEEEVYQARMARAEAQEAHEVLNSRAFQKCVQAVRDDIVKAFMKTDTIKTDELVLQKLRVECLEDVLTRLRSVANQSIKANHVIKAFEEQKRGG